MNALGISQGVGEALVEMYLGLSAAVGVGGVILETSSLAGARALNENQTVAKCALTATAMVGACMATIGLGCSSTLFIHKLTSKLLGDDFATRLGCSIWGYCCWNDSAYSLQSFSIIRSVFVFNLVTKL